VILSDSGFHEMYYEITGQSVSLPFFFFFFFFFLYKYDSKQVMCSPVCCVVYFSVA